MIAFILNKVTCKHSKECCQHIKMWHKLIHFIGQYLLNGQVLLLMHLRVNLSTCWYISTYSHSEGHYWVCSNTRVLHWVRSFVYMQWASLVWKRHQDLGAVYMGPRGTGCSLLLFTVTCSKGIHTTPWNGSSCKEKKILHTERFWLMVISSDQRCENFNLIANMTLLTTNWSLQKVQGGYNCA